MRTPFAGGIMIRPKETTDSLGRALVMVTPESQSSSGDRNEAEKDLAGRFRSMGAERKGSCSENAGEMRSAGTPFKELGINGNNNFEQPLSRDNAAMLTHSKIRAKQTADPLGRALLTVTPEFPSSSGGRNEEAKDSDDRFRSMRAMRKGSCSDQPVTELGISGNNNFEQLVSRDNAAMLTRSKSLSANGNGRSEWGKNFLQKFGNSTACGDCSSSERHMRSEQDIIRSEWGKNFLQKFGNSTACGDCSRSERHMRSELDIIRAPGEDGPNTIPTEELIPIVVDSTSDLLESNPETTLIEFRSDIDGRELGRLFRIAKVLGFKNFVRDSTLERAVLHYACSSLDGQSQGHNLDDEAREALGRNQR